MKSEDSLIKNKPASGPVPEETVATENRLSAADFTLLDSADFCAYFKIGSRTEFRWRKSGTVPYIKIKGRIYYMFSDILDTLEKHKQFPETHEEEE